MFSSYIPIYNDYSHPIILVDSMKVLAFFSVTNTSFIIFFFSSRRRHTISLCDWSSDVCLPICPARSFHKRASEHIPEALLAALGPILEQIGSLTERIRQYDRKLETISKERYPETELLRQVEGIGPLTALTFVLTLEDPYRFEKSRSVGAYLGLVPATDRSGDRDPQKRISKEGDQMLRKLLVSSAHYILGP